MEIYYNGTDITGRVQVRECVFRDTHGRSDSLEITFENAARWYAWGPREDDVITVLHNGYSTGALYLNTVLPEEGRYRILATALPCRAKVREYRSYTDITLEGVLRSCAVRARMGFALWGADGGCRYPYLQQENEIAAAFAGRLLHLEGAGLKIVNGKYSGIGLEWAQDRIPSAGISLSAHQKGTQYIRSGNRLRELTVTAACGTARAEDTGTDPDGLQETLALPAADMAQAGRWARAELLWRNRKSETLIVESDFNPRYTALERVNVAGSTDAIGDWLIEETEHDLKELTTRIRMHRCIRSIR